jgi:hypothetical protein
VALTEVPMAEPTVEPTEARTVGRVDA